VDPANHFSGSKQPWNPFSSTSRTRSMGGSGGRQHVSIAINAQSPHAVVQGGGDGPKEERPMTQKQGIWKHFLSKGIRPAHEKGP
jgi:hypothetical protein